MIDGCSIKAIWLSMLLKQDETTKGGIESGGRNAIRNSGLIYGTFIAVRSTLTNPAIRQLLNILY
jgi:hypothetical protein